MNVLERIFVAIMEPMFSASFRIADAILALYLMLLTILAGYEIVKIINGEKQFNLVNYIRPAMINLLVIVPLTQWREIAKLTVDFTIDTSQALARSGPSKIETGLGIYFYMPTPKSFSDLDVTKSDQLAKKLSEALVATIIVDTGRILDNANSVFEVKTKIGVIESLSRGQYDASTIVNQLKPKLKGDYATLDQFVQEAEDILVEEVRKAMDKWNIFDLIELAVLYVGSTIFGWFSLLIFAVTGFIIFIVAIRYIFVTVLGVSVAMLIAPLAVALSPLSKDYVKRAFTFTFTSCIQVAAAVAMVPMFVGGLVYIAIASILHPDVMAIHAIIAALFIVFLGLSVIPQIIATISMVLDSAFGSLIPAMDRTLDSLMGFGQRLVAGFKTGYVAATAPAAPAGARVSVPGTSRNPPPTSGKSPSGSGSKNDRNGDNSGSSGPTGTTSGSKTKAESQKNDKSSPQKEGAKNSESRNRTDEKGYYQSGGVIFKDKDSKPIQYKDIDFKSNGGRPIVVLEIDEFGNVSQSYVMTQDGKVHYPDGRTLSHFDYYRNEYDRLLREGKIVPTGDPARQAPPVVDYRLDDVLPNDAAGRSPENASPLHPDGSSPSDSTGPTSSSHRSSLNAEGSPSSESPFSPGADGDASREDSSMPPSEPTSMNPDGVPANDGAASESNQHSQRTPSRRKTP